VTLRGYWLAKFQYFQHKSVLFCFAKENGEYNYNAIVSLYFKFGEALFTSITQQSSNKNRAEMTAGGIPHFFFRKLAFKKLCFNLLLVNVYSNCSNGTANQSDIQLVWMRFCQPVQ
jgi:hypothetical protein